MADHGLLDPGLDLDWLIHTSTILGQPRLTRLMGSDLDADQDRLTTTVARLARIAEKNS
jgi:hypothetical protein